jgi:hypothetical protein
MFIVFMIPRWRLAALTLMSALLVFESACQKVPLLAPSGSVITLTSSATVLPFNGTTTITGQVIEASGTPPHSGTHVTFTTTLGAIQPSDAVTDSSGIVKVQFSAGTSSGTATITAISGGASVGTNGAVKILVGAAAVGRVNVTANPATVPSTGGSTIITANVLDQNGNQLASAPVSFVTTAGTLSTSVAVTDVNGLAQTTLTTATTATVTASVGAQGAPSTGGSSSSGSGSSGSSGSSGGGSTTTTPTAGQASGSVTVGINGAPTIVITPPTAPPSVGIPAAFTFVVTAATANPTTVQKVVVNWGDGSSLTLGGFTGSQIASHIFSVAQTYVVTATLTDSAGNIVSVSSTVSVIPVPRPGITIQAIPGAVGTNSASFIITITMPAGLTTQNVTISFFQGDTPHDLGGAPTGTVTVPPHTYTQGAGTYAVTVTVLDSVGNVTQATTSVTVS